MHQSHFDSEHLIQQPVMSLRQLQQRDCVNTTALTMRQFQQCDEVARPTTSNVISSGWDVPYSARALPLFPCKAFIMKNSVQLISTD